MAENRHIYRVSFVNQGKVYEIYAGEIAQSTLFGFIEIEQLLFGEKSAVLVDPSEERLKSEFEGVRRSHIPMHAVIRIDEVEHQGAARIRDVAPGSSGNVTPFPVLTPGKTE